MIRKGKKEGSIPSLKTKKKGEKKENIEKKGVVDLEQNKIMEKIREKKKKSQIPGMAPRGKKEVWALHSLPKEKKGSKKDMEHEAIKGRGRREITGKEKKEGTPEGKSTTSSLISQKTKRRKIVYNWGSPQRKKREK